MAIIGNLILQASMPVSQDVPGNNLLGYLWQDTDDSKVYTWNGTNWIYYYTAGVINGGLAPKSGFAATGPITGAHGLAPISSPNFQTSAKLNNVDLATVTQLDDLETSILSTVDNKISEAIASAQTGLSISNNIMVKRGYILAEHDTLKQVPAPVWPDGTTAAWTDTTWVANIVANGGSATLASPDGVGFTGNFGFPSGWKVVRSSENGQFKALNQDGTTGGGTTKSSLVEWVTISIRQGA